MQSFDNQTHRYLDRLDLGSVGASVKLHDNRLNHIYSKADVLDIEEDTDYLDDYLQETPHDRLFKEKKDLIETLSTNPLEMVQLHGTPEFQAAAKVFMQRHVNRLSTELGKEPCRVAPLG